MLTARKMGLIVAGLLLVLVVWFALRQPSHQRNWSTQFAQLPHIEESRQGFAVSPIRNWQWDKQGGAEQAATGASYSFAELRQIWLVVEPDPKNQIVAHTFLLFEFEQDRLLGLSVEARTEEGETWGPVPGLFRAYELIYVFASARDLLGLRARTRDHQLYIYPLQLTADQNLTLLQQLLARTRSLQGKARFYNTAFSNCTNELAKAAKLPWRAAFVLTGTADAALNKLGIIAGEDFAQVKLNAASGDFIRQIVEADNADFDGQLLAFLRKRK